MINGVSMTQPNNVAFQGRFSDMKERYSDMSKKEKAAVITATTAGIAAIGTGIIVRKDIKTLFKTGNFNKFIKDAGKTLKNAALNVGKFLKNPIKGIKNMFSKKKKPINVFSNVPGLSNDAKKALNKGRVQIANDIVAEMEQVNMRTTPAMHAKKEKELIKTFNENPNIMSRKDFFEGLFKDAQQKLGEAIIEKKPQKTINKLYDNVIKAQEKFFSCN